MIRVKNERFSRFFRTVPPFFSSRSIAAVAGTIQTLTKVGDGKNIGPEDGERRQLPVRKRVGERSFFRSYWGVCPNVSPSSSRPKPQGTVKTRYFLLYLARMRMRRRFVKAYLGIQLMPLRDTDFRRVSNNCVFTSQTRFKANISRYSKNEVLFTVPCICARELSIIKAPSGLKR